MVNEISNQAAMALQSTVKVDQGSDQTAATGAETTAGKQDVAALVKDNGAGQLDKADQISQTADRLNEIAQSIDRKLQFAVDDRTGDVVIKVIDKTTDKVIRQIPEERVLALRENIDSLKGILFSAKI